MNDLSNSRVFRNNEGADRLKHDDLQLFSVLNHFMVKVFIAPNRRHVCEVSPALCLATFPTGLCFYHHRAHMLCGSLTCSYKIKRRLGG